MFYLCQNYPEQRSRTTRETKRDGARDNAKVALQNLGLGILKRPNPGDVKCLWSDWSRHTVW